MWVVNRQAGQARSSGQDRAVQLHLTDKENLFHSFTRFHWMTESVHRLSAVLSSVGSENSCGLVLSLSVWVERHVCHMTSDGFRVPGF